VAERVVLHVGTMKSGTTFLQNVVSANQEPLRAQGVSFVGRTWRDQITAAQDAIEHGGEKQPALAADGPWARIVREIEEWPRTALFSVEFFGARKVTKIEQIVGSLGDTPVTVVLTARDLARAIPSMWQESVQNGGKATWEDYLRAVRAQKRGDALGDAFWRHRRALLTTCCGTGTPASSGSTRRRAVWTLRRTRRWGSRRRSSCARSTRSSRPTRWPAAPTTSG
jgi:hypothetical protein